MVWKRWNDFGNCGGLTKSVCGGESVEDHVVLSFQ